MLTSLITVETSRSYGVMSSYRAELELIDTAENPWHSIGKTHHFFNPTIWYDLFSLAGQAPTV
jgi:hypothetical protein